MRNNKFLFQKQQTKVANWHNKLLFFEWRSISDIIIATSYMLTAILNNKLYSIIKCVCSMFTSWNKQRVLYFTNVGLKFPIALLVKYYDLWFSSYIFFKPAIALVLLYTKNIVKKQEWSQADQAYILNMLLISCMYSSLFISYSTLINLNWKIINKQYE